MPRVEQIEENKSGPSATGRDTCVLDVANLSVQVWAGAQKDTENLESNSEALKTLFSHALAGCDGKKVTEEQEAKIGTATETLWDGIIRSEAKSHEAQTTEKGKYQVKKEFDEYYPALIKLANRALQAYEVKSK